MGNKEEKNVMNRAETFFPAQISYNLKGMYRHTKNKNIQNNRDVKIYMF